MSVYKNILRVRELRALFRPNDRLLIAIQPDPDSIASAIALQALVKGEVESVITHPTPVTRPENRAMIRVLRIRMTPLRNINRGDFSRVALLDGQPNQFPDFPGPFDIIIDHHPLREESRAAFTDIRPEYGANSSILTEYLIAAKMKIAPRLDTALCLGIKTDTANFVRGTMKADARAFGTLFPHANLEIFRMLERSTIPQAAVPILRQAVERLEIRNGTSSIYLGRVDSPDILVIIADLLIQIHGLVFLTVAGVYKHALVVVFRSDSPKINAGRLALRAFGSVGSAGGHRSAARAEVPLKNVPEGIENQDFIEVEEYITRQIFQKRAVAKTV